MVDFQPVLFEECVRTTLYFTSLAVVCIMPFVQVPLLVGAVKRLIDEVR